MAKINISIDDGLLDRLDRVADANYMSRSGLISTACAQYINSNEVIIAIRDMSLAMKKISEQGAIDEDTMRELEDFKRICDMFVGK